jgi:hypothetical protein
MSKTSKQTAAMEELMQLLRIYILLLHLYIAEMNGIT